jgi:1-acyl-sn-glycerol-3-phosphate acyltransferase
MIYIASWIASLIAIKLNFKCSVFGRENAPSEGPFIFVSNHASYIDPLVLGTSLPCAKWFSFVAKKDLFDKPLVGWYLRQIHALPLDREGDVAAVRIVIKLLRSGKSIILFPEGTRSKEIGLRPAKPGVGFIVAKAAVPVLPAYIEGSYEAMPAGKGSVKKGSRINVFIGKPLRFDNLDFNSRDSYQQISDDIMKSIAHLKDTHANKAS